MNKFTSRFSLYLIIFFCCLSSAYATIKDPVKGDVTSTQEEAITFVDKIKTLDSSAYWPNIKPALFLKNLKKDIYHPTTIFPGTGTNFCGYTAITYLLLNDDPLGYATRVLQLYKEGKTSFGNSIIQPSAAVKREAGLLKFQGVLDINPVEQMWFLSLADHYKGYLNFFNRKYNTGDENKFWASVNYAKFSRMARNVLHYTIRSKGSDMFRPHIDDLYEYIKKRTETGRVVLYINNRVVHKKKHVKIKMALPTHFIVVEKISKENGLITLIYWDYGGRTLLQFSPAFLKRIVFGITHFTKTEINEN